MGSFAGLPHPTPCPQEIATETTRTAFIWPYPLLCLLWRAGLRGVWLRLGRGYAYDASETVLHEPPGWLVVVLARSALGAEAIRAGGGQALRQTAAALHSPVNGGRTRRPPPLLGPFLAAALPRTRRLWVPTPSPVWDPATWTIVRMLEDAWEDHGITCIGRERRQFFALAGTRRLARRHGWPRRRALACGRTAWRLWRHWFTTLEQPRLDRIARADLTPALRAAGITPLYLYRHCRAMLRGRDHASLAAAVRAQDLARIEQEARASAAELTPPVCADWTPPNPSWIALALLRSPMGVAAADGLSAAGLRTAAKSTAARLLRAFAAPWPWTPRPVVKGPRRRRLEARRRAGAP